MKIRPAIISFDVFLRPKDCHRNPCPFDSTFRLREPIPLNKILKHLLAHVNSTQPTQEELSQFVVTICPRLSKNLPTLLQAIHIDLLFEMMSTQKIYTYTVYPSLAYSSICRTCDLPTELSSAGREHWCRGERLNAKHYKPGNVLNTVVDKDRCFIMQLPVPTGAFASCIVQDSHVSWQAMLAKAYFQHPLGYHGCA